MPKIVPSDWSKYIELDRAFDYLTANFRDGAEQLKTKGLICSVKGRDDVLTIRVERNGNTVAGLDIQKGQQMGDDKITWSVGHHIGLSNGVNGWATPNFDKQRGVTVLEVQDLAGMARGGDAGDGSDESFFGLLWDKLVEQIEQS